MENKYKIVGTIRNSEGELKLRFVNQKSNIQTYLHKQGYYEPKMIQLSKSLTKQQACVYMLSLEIYTEEEKQLIKEYINHHYPNTDMPFPIVERTTDPEMA